MDDTHDSQDIPLVVTSVKTFPEAVQISLREGLKDNSLFIFARALKAFAFTTGQRLKLSDLKNAFALWWNTATSASFLPMDASFDEWQLDFLATFDKTRAPLGLNLLQESVRRADSNPLPPQAASYSDPRIQRLVAVCHHLQLLQGESPIILSVRDTARILGFKNLDRNALDSANSKLHGLVSAGILKLVEKGKRLNRKASRFRFNFES